MAAQPRHELSAARRRDDFWVVGISSKEWKGLFRITHSSSPDPIMVVNWQEDDVDCSLNTNTTHPMVGMRRNQKKCETIRPLWVEANWKGKCHLKRHFSKLLFLLRSLQINSQECSCLPRVFLTIYRRLRGDPQWARWIGSFWVWGRFNQLWDHRFNLIVEVELEILGPTGTFLPSSIRNKRILFIYCHFFSPSDNVWIFSINPK